VCCFVLLYRYWGIVMVPGSIPYGSRPGVAGSSPSTLTTAGYTGPLLCDHAKAGNTPSLFDSELVLCALQEVASVVVRGCRLDRQTAQRTTRNLVRQLVSSGTRPHTLPALLWTFATHLWLQVQVGRTRWLRRPGCLPSTSRPCSTTRKPLHAMGCRQSMTRRQRHLGSAE